MNSVWGLVEVRPAIADLDERSPLAGIARRRFGGKSLLEWVVRHVSDALSLSRVAVIAGSDPVSRSLCEFCPPDVPVVHCAATDALGQLAEAVQKLECQSLVRLNVCQPFVDPVLVDRLVSAALSEPGCDYATYQSHDGRLAAHSELGVCAEWVRGEAVTRANKLAKSAADRAPSTEFIARHPDVFRAKLLAVPARLDRSDLQLAIQDEDGWHHVQELLDVLGPESLDWQVIANLAQRPTHVRSNRARPRVAQQS